MGQKTIFCSIFYQKTDKKTTKNNAVQKKYINFVKNA